MARKKQPEAAKPSKNRSVDPTAGWPVLPQVDLLPPAIRDKRALRITRRRVGFALVAVVVAVLLGYGLSTVDALSAKSDRNAADAEYQTLMVERAKYSEIPKTEAQIAKIDSSTERVMGTEVAWQPLLVAIRNAVPSGSSLVSLNVTVDDPLEQTDPSDDPLVTAGIGRGTIVLSSKTVPDAAKWLTSLNKIKGISDPLYSSAQVTDDDGKVSYTVTTTVTISDEALSGKYTGDDEASDTTDESGE